jgi:hypothetical protein
MRLFLYDKFFEKFIDLPKAIQNKVLDFQKKFRGNSRSAAIHLEPISTFTDQTLRTARVDDKYRAIIKVPERGDDYFLLWVDTHDEAMNWARNKVIAWNEKTQVVQIFTAPADPDKNNPVTRDVSHPTLYGHLSDQQLLSIGVPSISLEMVKNIMSLNELEQIEKNLPEDVFENLFYLADGADIDNLIFEIEEGKTKSAVLEDQVQSINNKRNFVAVEDKILADLIHGELKKWQVFLHPSQRKLVEGHFKGPVKVTGGGGTGKTVAALHRLKYLTIAEINLNPQPILFATFTTALTANLGKLIEGLGIPSSRYHLANIDLLARELALRTGVIAKGARFLDFPNSKSSLELWDEVLEQTLCQFDASFLHSEYQEVILYNAILTQEEYFRQSRIGRGKPITRKQRMEVWNCVEAYITKKQQENLLDRAELFNKLSIYYNCQEQKPFSNIIVDEIQDFSNIELRFIRSLVEEKENDMFLVGDPYQRIYRRKINFASAGIHVRGTRSKRLRINYRTTEEIKRLAISAVKGYAYDNFEGEAEKLDGYLSLYHGEIPQYNLFSTKADEVVHIVNFIKTNVSLGLRYGEMAIATRLKDSLREIKSALHKDQIPYYDLTSQSGTQDGIAISTFHSLKGLEFKIVILADVNYRTAPFLPQAYNQFDLNQQEEHLLSERALIYVAFTRAVQKVEITGTGTKSNIIQL